jgi:Tol biopolymer transport system component
MRGIRTAQAAALAWLLLATAPAAGAAGRAWDVADTGQPYREIEVTVTEGSWMSLDVSPDGATIVFDLLNDIYEIPASGGEARLIHGGPATQVTPVFSPDGKKLAYLSDESGADNLWISDVDGRAARAVTTETVDMPMAPTWTSRGDGLAAALMPAAYPNNATEIRLFDFGGGAGRTIVETPKNGRDVQEAAFSPDGRYLYYTERLNSSWVYVDANHVNFAIRRRDLATGQVEEVASGFGGATSPQISPDGRQLAFVRRVKAKTVLFVLDLASREQRPVYDGLDRDVQADWVPHGAYYPHFDWFPDNRHVAIWAKGRIQKVDTETGQAAEIPFHVTARHRITEPVRTKLDLAPEQVRVRTFRHLAPAPNGRDLLVTALGHIWRVEGAVPRRLTSAAVDEFEPRYSADGKRLVYVEWDDERGSALKVARADGHGARTIATSRGVIRQPTFSPNGREVAYRIQAPDKTMGGYRARPGIYRAPADGGASIYLAAGDDAPMFSPDGQRIYFVVVEQDGENYVHRLVSVTRDGLDRREHGRTPDADTIDLRVSPDLRWIAFRDRQQYYVTPFYQTGSPQLVSAAADAFPVRKLTDQGGYGLTWAPDSSRLYWTLGPALYAAAPSGDEGPRRISELDLKVPGDAPRGAIALTNARVLTMRPGEIIERGTVVVQGNRIAAVGPAGSVTVPAGAKVFDVAGKTIMPGLVEMHGHVDCCFGTGAMPQQQYGRYAELAFGVTTVFDPYSNEQTTYESAERTEAGLMVGPRWIGSGSVIYGRSKKPDFVYVPIDSYADAQAVMARKAALGGVVIKSYKQPARQQRQMLVKAGREAGVMIDAEGESHLYYNISMVLDGHTNLEHNLPLANYYDDVVQFMGKAGAHNTPVLNVTFGELFGENYMYQRTRAWDDPKVRTYVHEVVSGYSPLLAPSGGPPYVRGMTTIHVADELYEIGVLAVSRSIRKLDDAGVTINVGSHGDFPGLGIHWEMELLAAGGMSNERILRAATLNGARTLGFDHQLGTLEPGKLADLIVLDKDPLADIRNTNSVRYTMANGRLYDAMSMAEIAPDPRPRRKFYWELLDTKGIDWNETWSGQ